MIHDSAIDSELLFQTIFTSYNLNKQLRMLMVILYSADGLKAPLMSVQMFVEAFQQVLMEEMYVALL